MTARIEFNSANGDANDETIIEGEAEDISDLEDSIDAELNAIFAELGSDKAEVTFKIRVDKVLEGKGEMAYCFSCLPSELPIMDRIRDDFGSGKYQIRVWKIVPGTGARLIKKPIINIMSPIKKKTLLENNMPDMPEIMRAISESNKQTLEQVHTLLSMNKSAPAIAAPQINPMQMLIDLAPVIAALKGLFPTQNNNANIEMLVKGMDLMKDVNSDSGGEKGLADVLITAAKEFGGPILEMTKVAAAQGPVPAPAHVQVPGTPPPVMVTHPPIINTPTLQSQSETNQMGMMLKMQVNGLVQKAENKADPALYADLIIDSMTELQIKEFIGRPDLKEFLISINPKIATLWPWFEQLRVEVLAGLTSSVDEVDTSSAEIQESVTDAVTQPSPGDTPTNP